MVDEVGIKWKVRIMPTHIKKQRLLQLVDDWKKLGRGWVVHGALRYTLERVAIFILPLTCPWFYLAQRNIVPN